MLRSIKNSWFKCFLYIIMYVSIYVVFSVNQTNVLQLINDLKGTGRALVYAIYDSFFPYRFSSFVVVVALLLLILNAPEISVRWYDLIVSLCAGVTSLIGISLRSIGSWNLIKANLFISVIYTIGFMCFFTVIKAYIMLALKKLEAFEITENKFWTIINEIIDSKVFSFLFVFGMWLVWLILRYPGGVQWDEFVQIKQFLAHNITTQHWPVATTVYYGGFVYAGKVLLGSENIGLFLAILFQILYGAMITSYVLSILKKCKIQVVYRVITMLILTFNPIIARYISTASKDAAYAVTVLWLCGISVEFFVCKNDYKIRDLVRVAVCSVLLCLLRKNGSYTIISVLFVVVASFVFAKLRAKQTMKNAQLIFIVLALVSGVIVESIFSSVLACNGIPKGSFRESLSVPLQQTARLAKEAPDMVSEEDKRIINQVIDFDYIASAYYPKVSDAVKDSYYGTSFSDFLAYIKVWTKYLVKAPSIYFEAFFHMNGDFIDVNANHIELTKLDPEVTDRFMPWSIEGKFRVFTDFYERFPLIWPICNVGIQSWFCVYLLLVAIDRKDISKVIICLPAVITLFVCLLGPTFENQGIRYMVPIIVANPFVVNYFIEEKKSNAKTE